MEEQFDSESMLDLYLVLEAIQAFETEYKKLPGADDGDALWKVVCDVTREKLNKDREVKAEIVIEATRSGCIKMHSTGAIMGAVVAQEVVKVLVQQYTPLNNTMVWDGLSGRAQVFDL